MMVGLRVRDSSTNKVTLEVTDRLTRHLGSVETGEANGSITDERFSLGEPFFVVIDPNWQLWTSWKRPIPSINGNTLSWAFPDGFGWPTSVTILYGIS